MDDRYCYLLEPGASRFKFSQKPVPITALVIECKGCKEKMSDAKRLWNVSLRRRVLIFMAVCLLVSIKVAWMSFGAVRISNDEIARQRHQWLTENFNITVLLLEQLKIRSTPYHHYFSDESFAVNQSMSMSRYNPHLTNVSCKAMFTGDQKEMREARHYMHRNKPNVISDIEYVNMTEDCEEFRQSRGYFKTPLSKEESEFPIAFSILIYKDMNQIERLLRAIYMPQNFYCLHIDLKADDMVHIAARSIARCFPNVFVASRLESVFWGHISIMYAEMNCLNDLLQYQWKYFINLSGQMFPLHTNRELVKILTLYNGANDIEGTYDRGNSFFLRLRQWVSWNLVESLSSMMPTIYPKTHPPHNVTIYKGSNQVAISRAFAVYFLYSPISKDLIEWFSDTLAPDEYIWPTLNHNPHLHAPGAYKGDPESKTFTARATIWAEIANQKDWSWEPWECQGKWVREICILGVGDMPWLYHRPELFVNKIHSAYEWLTFDCMEQLMFNRTMAGGALTFDSTYYDNLPFVKYKQLVVSPQEAMSETAKIKR